MLSCQHMQRAPLLLWSEELQCLSFRFDLCVSSSCVLAGTYRLAQSVEQKSQAHEKWHWWPITINKSISFSDTSQNS